MKSGFFEKSCKASKHRIKLWVCDFGALMILIEFSRGRKEMKTPQSFRKLTLLLEKWWAWYHKYTSSCYYCDKRFILQLTWEREERRKPLRQGGCFNVKISIQRFWWQNVSFQFHKRAVFYSQAQSFHVPFSFDRHSKANVFIKIGRHENRKMSNHVSSSMKTVQWFLCCDLKYSSRLNFP